MKERKMDIEELFRKGFDNHALNPSELLLKRIRLRLWIRDFISLNFKTFNFVYALAIITGFSIPVAVYLNHNKVPFSEINNSDISIPIVNVLEKNDSTISKENIESAEDKTVLAENNLPALSFAPSVTQGCSPLMVIFRNTTQNAEKYRWDFGNGITSNEKNPKVKFIEAGQYTITLTATSVSGTKNTLKQTIIVYPAPTASAEIDIDDSDIKTRKVTFLNKSKDAASYLWNFGDNISSSKDNSVVHNYKHNGKYKVTLIAYSAYGCSDTAIIENNFIERDYEMSFPPKFRPGTYNSQNSGFYENAAEQNFIFFPLNNGAHSYELRIYTPNGIEVFKTTNIKQGWNGFIKGRVAPPGRYSFIAKGVYPNGKKFEIKSFVDVIVDEVNGYY
jgi:PKD repeat protein